MESSIGIGDLALVTATEGMPEVLGISGKIGIVTDIIGSVLRLDFQGDEMYVSLQEIRALTLTESILAHMFLKWIEVTELLQSLIK